MKLFLAIVAAIFTIQSVFAAEQKLLLITGEDADKTVAIEDTVASVVDDGQGGFGALKLVSENGTVNETYTYDQLIQMHGAPIKYAGFTVLIFDTRNFTKQGGTLVVKYPHDVLAFIKDYGQIEIEVTKTRGTWIASANDSAGRRHISRLDLVLNAGEFFGNTIPVGVATINAR